MTAGAGRPAAAKSPVSSARDRARACDGSRSFSIRLNAAARAGSGETAASATTTRPPGAHTRTISRSTAPGSGKWWNAKRETTREKVPSS